MTAPDIFGRVLDPARVEDAVRDTLKAWLPDHLAKQERENGRAAGSLQRPRSWPTISTFQTRKHEQLPAIVIVCPGTAGRPTRHASGRFDFTWRIEVAAVLSAPEEDKARRLASMYVAAVTSALLQNRTLGGIATGVYVTGHDYEYGTTNRGDPRAIYAAAFEIDVADVVNDRKGPTQPSPDPQNPPAPPQTFTSSDISDITVESETLP